MPTFYCDISTFGVGLLSVGPFVCQYLWGIYFGGAVYIALAACYLSYVHADKELKERKLANALVADYNKLREVVDKKVLRRVMEYLPGYMRNPGMEQCGWANMAAAAVFPYAATFIAGKVKNKMNEKFRNMKGMAEISLEKLDAGDVCPTCTGVLVHPYKNDKKIVIEGDLVWNGRPNIEIKVQVGGQGFTIEIYEVTLCAQLRIVAAPLCVAATPVKTLGISFRTVPYIHFGMRIGGVDVMHLGTGAAQVCHLVDRVLKRAISDMMIYPNNLWIQLDKTYDIRELSTKPLPRGLLSVHVVSAKDLVVADVTSSDPYLKLTIGVEERSTKIVKRNLNPVWNEKFVMIVYNIDMQLLELNCFDSDLIGADDPLGRATFKLSELEFYKREQRDIILEGVEHGSVQLDMMYIPLDDLKPDDPQLTEVDMNTVPQLALQFTESFHAGTASTTTIEYDDDEEDDEISVLTNTVTPTTANGDRDGKSPRSPRFVMPGMRKQASNRSSGTDPHSRSPLNAHTSRTSSLDETGTEDGIGTTDDPGVHNRRGGAKLHPKKTLKGKVLGIVAGHRIRRNSLSGGLYSGAAVGYGVIVFDMISCANLTDNDKSCEAFVQFKLKAGAKSNLGDGEAARPESEKVKEEDSSSSLVGTKNVTEIIYGTNDPRFARAVTFIISSDQKTQYISVKVKDHGQKNKVLGEAQIRIEDIIQAGSMDREMKISPLRAESVVRFRAVWCKASYLPRVYPPPPSAPIPTPPHLA